MRSDAARGLQGAVEGAGLAVGGGRGSGGARGGAVTSQVKGAPGSEDAAPDQRADRADETLRELQVSSPPSHRSALRWTEAMHHSFRFFFLPPPPPSLRLSVLLLTFDILLERLAE